MDLPPSDFDGAWKYALEQFFGPFLELFFPAAYAAIDWTQPVTFRETELQQIAPEDQAGQQRVDKLVRVRRRDGDPVWVLVHVEVQSQHDASFAERMFRYHARLFDRDRIPVVSLAVLGDEAPGWRPDRFGYDLWGCELSLRFPTVNLLDLDPVMLAATPNPFAVLTLLHRDAQATRDQPAERLQRKVARYRALLEQGYTAQDVRALLRLMEHVLRLDPALARRAFDEMRHIELEVYGMETFVTSFEEIGRAEGLAEGLAKGRDKGLAEGLAEGQLKGQREIVVRLLIRKIGTLPEAVQERVSALSADQILDLSEALLDFGSLTDLTTWLDAKSA
ncbi:MAG: DUF4351 domain-containing protein [Chloroflexales bacterium]|nr:DUF4351 domain-containing protein [Chloroflexales bacterium]